MLKNRTILHGDVLEKLKEIPDEFVDCIISSPPYWGLRDYGIKDQWGLEPDFRDYLKKMQLLMNELKRVLKKSGSCWINLGDTYGTHSSGQDRKSKNSIHPDELKNYVKSRLGIPERFYIDCIDNGWIVRNHIPWIKENAMPASVKDRFQNKWESIFFFVKSQKYYFNLDKVREKPKTISKPFNLRVRENITGKAQMKLGDNSWFASKKEMENYNKDGTRKEPSGDANSSSFQFVSLEPNPNWKEAKNKQDSTLGADGKPKQNYKGFNERWKVQSRHNVNFLYADSEGYNQKGKNPGDVFYINPKPIPEAHFATFPIELPEKILNCACPEKGIVLDPFFGSGTVGVAAEKLNRQWLGIELKQEYIDIATKRLESYNITKLDNYLV